MATAVVRALAVSPAKGNNRAAQLFMQMIKVTEQEDKNLHFSYLHSMLDYKNAWYKELRRREQLGISGPEPLPHPDDLIINIRTGNFAVRGPPIEAEKDLWLAADILKTEYRRIIATNERQLRPPMNVSLGAIRIFPIVQPYSKPPREQRIPRAWISCPGWCGPR